MMTYMLIPVALFRIFGPKVAYVLTLQDGDPYERVFGRLRIKPFIPLIDYGFRHATVIQVISDYLALWPRKRGYEGEVIKIFNGANPRDLKESVSLEEVEALKKKLGKKSGEIWLVNTARLEYQKAQDAVIRALAELPEHIKFLVVGGGADEKMLKDLTKELKLEGRVIFTGHVDRSEVTLYRRASDIFVGASRSEGLGDAFLSAMASRLPVVATQAGGLAEFIFDENKNPDKPATAWAVDADSPKQIKGAIENILSNPEKVRKVTERARNMVLEKFNWDIIAKKMRSEIFGEVLKSRCD
jgi:glycosyltransferase involved in cell wall biosynthesis